MVRRAGAQDAETIVSLIQELAKTSNEKSPVNAQHARQCITEDRYKIFVAEAENKAVGMVSFYIHPSLFHAANACLIDDLVVAESARGKGVGDALMEAVLKYAREEKHCAEISLAVAHENKKAQALYRKHGLTDEVLMLERHY